MIVRRLNIRGGTQRQALTLAEHLTQLGHSVEIFTFYFEPHDTFQISAAVKVTTLEENVVHATQGSWRAWKVVAFLRNEFLNPARLARKIPAGFNLLNPHDQVSYRVAAVAKKRLHIPSVWIMNDPATRALSVERCRMQGIIDERSRLKKMIDWMIDAYDIRTHIVPQDAVVVLDERDAMWARSEYRIPVHILRPGVTIESFPFRERNISRTAPKLLLFGIFFPHRRFEDGIRALQLLRHRGIQATLTIAGEYAQQRAYEQSLRQLVHELGLDECVTFYGAVSDEQLADMYLSHDVFLFPSHIQSWGIAVCEALSTGMPVIVSRTAGASEVLTHGVHALLHAPFDTEAIAAHVTFLTTHPDVARALGKEGRALIERSLTSTAQAKALNDVFTTYIT